MEAGKPALDQPSSAPQVSQPRRQTRLKCSGTSVPQRFIDWDGPIPDSLCQRFSTGQFHDAAVPAEHAQKRSQKTERLQNLVAEGGAKPETQIAIVVANAVGNGFASSNESQIAGPPKLRGEVMREVRFNDKCWILLTRLGMERLIVVGVNVDRWYNL